MLAFGLGCRLSGLTLHLLSLMLLLEGAITVSPILILPSREHCQSFAMETKKEILSLLFECVERQRQITNCFGNLVPTHLMAM